jgi:hypothetical protein
MKPTSIIALQIFFFMLGFGLGQFELLSRLVASLHNRPDRIGTNRNTTEGQRSDEVNPAEFSER